MIKKFRGHYLTPFDGADYNRYYNALSENAKIFYNCDDANYYIDENNGGIIYKFYGNVCEQNLVATYGGIEELNVALEEEADSIGD